MKNFTLDFINLVDDVINDNKKHFDSLMSEYREFAEKKENRDVKDTVIVEKK